jgi:prepilin-type N-terminal cleavage/methylation domain-containing protein
MRPAFTKSRGRERGFSLLEMMLATIILLVGLVAIAQLVPASILLNFRNRNDSTALVFAQRELDQMLAQSLNPPGSPPSFINAEGKICYLGDPTQPNTRIGNPVVTINDQAYIDFSATTGTANYSFTYADPADPSGTIYDIRWAVIITGNSTRVFSKRFILGIQQKSGNGYFQPVTLDTMVEK